jgi:hypothetical protein
MVVSANTFFDGSVELPDPPKTGASISINAFSPDARKVGARRLTWTLNRAKTSCRTYVIAV